VPCERYNPPRKRPGLCFKHRTGPCSGYQDLAGKAIGFGLYVSVKRILGNGGFIGMTDDGAILPWKNDMAELMGDCKALSISV
jgi:hypothetical protein